MKGKTDYSVIVPVYNSDKTLVELTERLKATFLTISGDYEIILVDDCSTDSSWDILKNLHQADEKIKIIRLQRNFGQHNAILCGFNYASGDYVITLDDDLQHPPEEIPKLISTIKKGYSVVYGRYLSKQHSPVENFFSNIFQKFIHWILEIPGTIYISSFTILSSDVVKNMVQIKVSNIFLPALVRKSVSSDKIANTDVVHNPRKVGRSNYTLRKYLALSLSLMINNSVLPLLIVGVIGIIVSILSICYGFFIVGRYLIDPTQGVIGWNSLMVAIACLGGMILFSIAIIGEYLRRILTEVSYGQQYVVGELNL